MSKSRPKPPVSGKKHVGPVAGTGGLSVEDRQTGESQTLMIDPWDFYIQQSFMEEMQTHSRFSVGALRSLADAPYVAPIISTRVNQVAELAVEQDSPFSLGFKLLPVDKKVNSTRATEKEARRITDMVLNCGTYRNDDERYTRDDFETFLRKITRDAIILNTPAFEVVPDKTGKPAEWLAADAGTIFRCTPKTPYEDTQSGENRAAFVQVLNDQEVAYYTSSEMAFAARNPRTEVKNKGYGHPELLDLMSVMLNLSYAFLYNQNYFKLGGQKGVLAVMGEMSERQFEGFKRMMVSATSGVKNAFRLAMVNPQGPGADIKWVPFGATNRDMEFSEWINWNYKIACANFGIAPEETGFYYGNEGGGQAMFESSAEAKIRMGKSKGLRPLVRFIEKLLNRYIISRLNPDFRIQFLGLDTMTEDSAADLDKKRVSSYMTLNELRAEKGMKSLGEAADIVLDPTYMQRANVMEQLKQQGGGGDDEGDGGDEGGQDDEGQDDSEGWDDSDFESGKPPTSGSDTQEEGESEGEDGMEKGFQRLLSHPSPFGGRSDSPRPRVFTVEA